MIKEKTLRLVGDACELIEEKSLPLTRTDLEILMSFKMRDFYPLQAKDIKDIKLVISEDLSLSDLQDRFDFLVRHYYVNRSKREGFYGITRKGEYLNVRELKRDYERWKPFMNRFPIISIFEEIYQAIKVIREGKILLRK